MPQMSPLNWIFMFLVFIFLILIVMNKIYFLLNKNTSEDKTKKMMLQKEIKWSW